MRLIVSAIFVIILVSCGGKKAVAPEQSVSIAKPCQIRVEAEGDANNVSFYCFLKGGKKMVSIEKTLELKKGKPEVFNLNGTTGSDIECYLKTDDSYGPEVSIKIFLNNVLWNQKKDSYMPKVSGKIPFN